MRTCYDATSIYGSSISAPMNSTQRLDRSLDRSTYESRLQKAKIMRLNLQVLDFDSIVALQPH